MCRRESAGFPNSGSPKVGVLTEWDGGISSLRCSRMGKTQNNQQQLWGAGGDGKYPHFPRNWKVRPKNNSSLLKKKKVWQDALQKRKYQSVQALFTFSMSYICFCFPSLPFGLTKPYLFLLDRGYDLEIVRHSCG